MTAAAIPASLQEMLARYRRKLEMAWPGRVHEMLLFGSWARGEATEDSDVDVLVILDDSVTTAERAHAIDLATLTGLEDDAAWVVAPRLVRRSRSGSLATR